MSKKKIVNIPLLYPSGWKLSTVKIPEFKIFHPTRISVKKVSLKIRR